MPRWEYGELPVKIAFFPKQAASKPMVPLLVTILSATLKLGLY